MAALLTTAALAGLLAPESVAHDIPNARVDRATQVTVSPGRLRVDYEVSLSELTLTQELRGLVGQLPGSDRAGWFSAYARETGPLNAKGFLVDVDGKDVALTSAGFDLVVEEHPRFTFHFEAALPESGRLRVNDTNFVSSEGTSRLAVRGERGVTLKGDTLPPDVASIPARSAWQLSDAEEARTRRVQVDFAVAAAAPVPVGDRAIRRVDRVVSPPRPEGLSRLLDGTSALSLVTIGLMAFGLGAVHALQPGHGKTLVVATVLGDGDGGGPARAALLAAVTTLTHTGSVFLVAFGLWWTASRKFGDVHVVLTRTAGYLMAAVGCWRIGRTLGGFPLHEEAHGAHRPARGLLALGVAGGIVPCWDAVGLVVIGEAVGRLGLALGLVVVFSLGLGLVLTLVGWFAERVRRGVGDEGRWPRRLGLASSVVLSAMGVYLLTLPSR